MYGETVREWFKWQSNLDAVLHVSERDLLEGG